MFFVHAYSIQIKERDIDFYGHVNNAVYLILYEEARWDMITSQGYSAKKIKETGYGPVVLEVNVKYLKELNLRDEIIIKSQVADYTKKIFCLKQEIWRGEEICSLAEFKMALFDLNLRKIIHPTEAWLKAISWHAQPFEDI